MYRKFQTKEVDIRKKLMESGITKSEQFQEIISNLMNQRERLEGDLKILRQKVVALQAKHVRKLNQKPARIHVSAGKKQVNYRQQLNKKYEQLKNWQKKSVKAMNNSTIQIQYRAYLDKLFTVQQQIQQTLKQINDERITYDRFKKTLKHIKKDNTINNNMHEGIERQNTLLKKRVLSLKKIVDRQIGKELELHNYLIDMKEKERQIRDKERQRYVQVREVKQVERERGTRLKSRQNVRVQTEYVKGRQTSELSQQSQLIVDVDLKFDSITSKEQIYQIQGRLNRILKKYRTKITQIDKKIKIRYPNEALIQRRQGSKLAFGRQFEITMEKAKINLHLLSNLHNKQIQLLFTALKERNKSSINLYSRKSSEESLNLGIKINNFHKNSIVNFQSSKYDKSEKGSYHQGNNGYNNEPMNKIIYPRTFRQQDMQSQQPQYRDPQPLRKQFVGTISEDLTVFDRNILKGQKSSTIQSLHIYYTDRGISTVKAIYNIHKTQNHQLQSKMILPEPFLQNYCKVHIISTSSDDFIRYFKIKFNKAENRVINIKIVTNRNIKNGWGDYKFKEDYDKDEIQDQEIIKELILDIDKDEYPVSIFCSHTQKGPYWYLSGFGVEINEL